VAAINSSSGRQVNELKRLHVQLDELVNKLATFESSFTLQQSQQQAKETVVDLIRQNILNRVEQMQVVVRNIAAKQIQLQESTEKSLEGMMAVLNYSVLNEPHHIQRTDIIRDQLISAFNASIVKHNAIVQRIHTLESELSDRLDRLQLNISIGNTELKEQHDNLLHNVSRIPGRACRCSKTTVGWVH